MSRRGKKRNQTSSFLPELAAPERGAPRRLRVERDLRDLLAGALGGLSDPRLTGVAITRIELTDDLSYARIYVRSSLGGDERALMRGLTAATGRLRADVSQQLQLRRAPELRFFYDRGVEHAERVDELLREIAQDSNPGEDPGPSDL